MEVVYTPHFKRQAKRLPVSLRPMIEARITLFCDEPFDPLLRTHKLQGSLKGYWAFAVDYRHRIIFEFEGKSRAIFHSVGDHSIYD